MSSKSRRLIIGVVLLVIILLVLIILVGAALLMATGNAPSGEFSGVYGIVLGLEAELIAVITALAGLVDLFAEQLQHIGELI